MDKTTDLVFSVHQSASYYLVQNLATGCCFKLDGIVRGMMDT